MTNYVLDTNIISLALRSQNSNAFLRLSKAIAPGNMVLGCPVVWYEVRRGLLAKDARTQINYFEDMFKTFVWQDYSANDWTLASELWSQRRAQGLPISDADLLIGVFARNRNAILVTDNEKDFANLGVTMENWK